MPAKDLGTKHLCFKCGTKFYDLRKSEPICPKCGADQRQSPALKPASTEKRSRAPARPAAPAPLLADEAEAETAELEEDAEADEEAEEAEDDDEKG
jgi:uncharacterized protein (TIGR02300 family)